MRIVKMEPKLYASMESRVSRRKYTAPPAAEQLDELKRYAEELNEDAGGAVRIGLWADGAEDVFGGLSNSYGMFSGVKAFAAFIGREKGEEARVKTLCGYYGEQFVLKANALGLGTCWVAGTFDKAMAKRIAGVGEGELLICVAPLGAVPDSLSLREKMVKGFSAGRKRKPLEQLLRNPGELETAPDWMKSALAAARTAPSAMNSQPWRFTLLPAQNALAAQAEGRTHLGSVDLGISMAHIEIAALQAGVSGVWTEEAGTWTFTAK
ncbi:nitroreductase family protein [Paenibacillus durus]|uniref:nitroreductase family protein n=1 Tax=Paenibacillus durus TaxID=44251 RepID=UPI00046F115E|nr:nitroreductase family protein [Paenibacillus durus]